MELVEKFSGSASLRRDYAEFCDIVLNDFEKAEMHRHGADLLESGVHCTICSIWDKVEAL